MNSDKAANCLGRPRSTKLFSAVVTCLAIATVGYVIATDLLMARIEATAAVTRSSAMMKSEAQTAARYEPPATAEPPRLATAREPVESPRECVLEKGIIEACAFN